MPEGTEVDQKTLARRWERAEAERPLLVRIARRQGLTLEDAEDCVQEAMLRVVVRPDLDEDRMGALLTTVVIRCAVDFHRRTKCRTSVIERAASVLTAIDDADPATVVCDRDEARWTARLVGRLPASQRRALLAKAEGRAVRDIAADMSTTAKAVESLLSRARAAARSGMASGLSAVVGWCRRLKLVHGAATAAAGAVVVGLTAPGLHLPYWGGGHGPRDTPAAVELAAGPSLGAALAGGSAQPATSPAARTGDQSGAGSTTGARHGANREWKQVHKVDAVVPGPNGDVGASLEAGTQPSDRTREEKLADCLFHGPNLDYLADTYAGPCRRNPGNPAFTETNNATIGVQQ
jgi:RNA polymerase sigma factor (sigma-70 family)